MKSKEAKEGFGFKETNSGKLKCSKCGYAFKYSVDMHKPDACPYCFNPIRRTNRF